MPTIKTSFLERPTFSRDQIGLFSHGGPQAGEVVTTCLGASIGGPFLVCLEHYSDPLLHNGSINGRTRYFLVSLESGRRMNLDGFHPDTRFYTVSCEMLVSS